MLTGGNQIRDALEPPSSQSALVRKLARRYLLVLATVIILIVCDQAVVQPLLDGMSSYAPVINVAGRQRMLSQKLTKAALALQFAESDAQRAVCRNELRETLAMWQAANLALRNGDAAGGIAKVDTAAIRSEWKRLEPHFEAMCVAAEELISSSDDSDSNELRAATSVLVKNEPLYLASMDRVVSLMESESAKAVSRLRLCAAAIAGTIILLVTGLGWFVIRPATESIRGQVDLLEASIATRTLELSSALSALRREVDEREAVDRKSHRLAEQLAHAGRVSSLGHLAGGLAHELNHPLATIANYIEACDVEISQLPPSLRVDRLGKHLGQTKQAALRAGTMIRRMREFVRAEAPATSEAGVNRLIREVSELCHAEIVSNEVELTLSLDESPGVIECDPIQIQQVLVNLIQNAIHAMLECTSGERRLVVCSAALADTVQVSVSDNGPGFLTTVPDIAFAPFHSTKRDGLGIGLSICRSIVEHHGGSIWVETPLDGGARVVFSLPLAKKHAAECSELAECVCR